MQRALTPYPTWLQSFKNPKTGEVRMCRHLVAECICNTPELIDVLGFNRVTKQVTARKPWPWRERAGPVQPIDELRLGDWLSERYDLPDAPRHALRQAIELVAHMQPYPP